MAVSGLVMEPTMSRPRWGRCHKVVLSMTNADADAGWELDFPARTLLAGPELYVGEWRCPGAAPLISRELSRHVELGLQRQGMHVRTVGRERRVVDPTTATFTRAGDEYVMRSPMAPQRSTAILIRGALLDEVAPRPDVRFARVSPDLARLHVRLHRALDPVEVEETALELLGRAVGEARLHRGEREASPARRTLAEEVRHVIATRFRERLTLGTIASACGHSTFYVSRAFRAATGETVHAHLNRVRLHAALFDVASSAGELTQLALAVGFSSHSHFTRAFRAEFGLAPSRLASCAA
jgi:AraC-like DNA-binding protein